MVKSLLQNKKNSGLYVLCVLLVSLLGPVEASQTGGISGAYLRLPAGATSMAMGGANSADPSYLATWWNPAVLSSFRGRRVAGGVGFRSLGRTEGFGTWEFRIPPRVGLGLTALYRGDPFIDNLYDIDENPLGRLSYTSLTFKVGVSYLVSRSLALGGNITVLYQNLPTTPEGNSVLYTTVTGIGAFDLALSYRISEQLLIGAIFKNLGAAMDWEIVSEKTLSPRIEDRPLPSITVASSYTTSLKGKPLVWNVDVVGYFFDGYWERLDRPEAIVFTGAEWRYWETFFVRAGIADLEINGDILRNSSLYFKTFSPRIAAGFRWDLSRVRKGFHLNYAIATDRVGAGVDQQLDFMLTF